MGAVTSAQSGPWNSVATWAGGVVPVAGDDITVAAGHSVTLDAAFICEKTLTVNGKLDTSTFALTVGNGASRDGSLTLGPGGELSLGSGGLVLNNCALLSAATSSLWAKITGSGAITRGTVYAAPKQRIIPRFISFQNAGAITLGAGNHSAYGSIASPTLDLTNTCFVGCGPLTFGQDGWGGQAATDMIFSRVDFRDTGDIRIRGYNGTITGRTVWEDVTLSHSTGSIDVSVIGRPGIDFRRCVFDSASWGAVQPHGQGGGHNLNNCLFAQHHGRVSRGASFAAFGATASVAAGDMRGCYALSTLENTHGVNAGGYGTPVAPVNVVGNVFEFESIPNPTFDDTGNFIIYGVPKLNISENLCIGTAVNFVGAAGPFSNPLGFEVVRNTVYCRNRATLPRTVQALGLYELAAEAYLGTDRWSSNLVAGDVPVEYGIHDNNAATRETISFSDYNFFWNVAQPYRGVVVMGRAVDEAGPNDIWGNAAKDPGFKDASRDLGAFAVYQGWASVSDTAEQARSTALAMFRRSNGYDEVTKVQVDGARSGADIAELVAYVRAGFTPTSVQLAGTGEGGVDIGAMAVVVMEDLPLIPWGVIPWGVVSWNTQ